jgi:hypothetical protein
VLAAVSSPTLGRCDRMPYLRGFSPLRAPPNLSKRDLSKTCQNPVGQLGGSGGTFVKAVLRRVGPVRSNRCAHRLNTGAIDVSRTGRGTDFPEIHAPTQRTFADSPSRLLQSALQSRRSLSDSSRPWRRPPKLPICACPFIHSPRGGPSPPGGRCVRHIGRAGRNIGPPRRETTCNVLDKRDHSRLVCGAVATDEHVWS